MSGREPESWLSLFLAPSSWSKTVSLEIFLYLGVAKLKEVEILNPVQLDVKWWKKHVVLLISWDFL